MSIVGSIPLLGGLLSMLGWLVFAFVSGSLGGAFAWHYNRNGRRQPFKALRQRREPK